MLTYVTLFFVTVNREVQAGLYLRMSEDKTGEGLGIARQRDECLALCAQRGWTVVEEFVDNDVSASTGRRRPAYERMLQAVRDGAINAVVCWDLDRLTRRPVETEAFIELADEYQLQLGSVGGDVDLGTDNGRLFARIKGAVARAEIERKSARQRAAARQAIAAGKPTGGRRAFGYTDDGMHLHPVEAPLVKCMFERFNAGATLGEIARWLNADGAPTVMGNKWTSGSVRQLLANPRFAGVRGQRKVKTDTRGRVLLTDSRTPKRDALYSVNGVKAVWPAIVAEEAWRSAVERITDPDRRVNYRGRERKYLLPGLARCGWVDASGEPCGKRLMTSSNNGMRVLKCPTLRHVNRRADLIEDFVVENLLARLRRPDAAHLIQPAAAGVDLRALRDEAGAIHARRKRQNHRYAAGMVTEAEYDDLLATTAVRLDEIDRELATAGRVDVVAKILGDGRDPGEVWEEWPLSTKRALIDAVVRVTVLPGRLGRPRGGATDPATIGLDWVRH